MNLKIPGALLLLFLGACAQIPAKTNVERRQASGTERCSKVKNTESGIDFTHAIRFPAGGNGSTAW